MELAIERFGKPVYVRKEIVHNRFVVNRLEEIGAVFVEENSEVPAGEVVIFSAHGVAPVVFDEANGRSLKVIDATCPLVNKVHQEAARYVEQGYHILLIGRAGHEEVNGTLGHAAGNITLIEDIDQARTKEIGAYQKLMVLTQTTLSLDDTEEIVTALRERFGSVDQPPGKDICYATQNRQDAVKEMCSRGIDLLLVVGSPNSSNAARLTEVGRVRKVRGFLIDNETDLNPGWFAGVQTVGVTGGASTPEEVVDKVIERLRDFGATDVEICQTAEENTVFRLPDELTRDELVSGG